MHRGSGLAPALLGDELFLPRDGVRIARALFQSGKQIALLIALLLAPCRFLLLPVFGLLGPELAFTRTLIFGQSGGAFRGGRSELVGYVACLAALGRSLAIMRDTSFIDPFVYLCESRSGCRHEDKKVQ